MLEEGAFFHFYYFQHRFLVDQLKNISSWSYRSLTPSMGKIEPLF